MTAAPAAAGAATPARSRFRLPSPRVLIVLWPRVRPYAAPLGFTGIALLVAAGIGLAFPQVVRHLLDASFEQRDARLLNTIALGLLALFAVQGLMNFVQVYVLHATAERVVAKLREDVFGHLVRLSPAFFTEQRTGELTSRLSADLAVLQLFLSTWVTELLRQLLLLIGGIVMLTLTHPSLTLTTLAVSPVIVGVAVVFGRALRTASTGVQDQVAAAMGTATEAFGQIRTVQSFTREGFETARFATALDGVVTAAVRKALLRGLFFGVVGFVAFSGVVAVLWQGGRLVLAGALTPGALVSFLLYALTIAAAVGSLASHVGSYNEAVGSAERVFDLLAMTPTVAEPDRPVVLDRPVRGEIVFDRVGFRYAPDLPDVLHEVTLRIAPGEVVALVGPSGAGKTTLASLIPRFWDATSGLVALDGHDVRELSLRDVRGAIGIVPQEPALFSGTVHENIAYGRPDASASAVEAAARAGHAAEFVERLPNGYATRVGERGVKLSGGQRQRIAIARVFLKDPSVLILDEATSALDSESERLVEEALAGLLQGRTTVIIAHRLSTVQRADRVVVMEHGRIVERGTHAELLQQEGVYAKLFRGQYRGELSDSLV